MVNLGVFSTNERVVWIDTAGREYVGACVEFSPDAHDLSYLPLKTVALELFHSVMSVGQIKSTKGRGSSMRLMSGETGLVVLPA